MKLGDVIKYHSFSSPHSADDSYYSQKYAVSDKKKFYKNKRIINKPTPDQCTPEKYSIKAATKHGLRTSSTSDIP